MLMRFIYLLFYLHFSRKLCKSNNIFEYRKLAFNADEYLQNQAFVNLKVNRKSGIIVVDKINKNKSVYANYLTTFNKK